MSKVDDLIEALADRIQKNIEGGKCSESEINEQTKALAELIATKENEEPDKLDLLSKEHSNEFDELIRSFEETIDKEVKAVCEKIGQSASPRKTFRVFFKRVCFRRPELAKYVRTVASQILDLDY